MGENLSKLIEALYLSYSQENSEIKAKLIEISKKVLQCSIADEIPLFLLKITEFTTKKFSKSPAREVAVKIIKGKLKYSISEFD